MIEPQGKMMAKEFVNGTYQDSMKRAAIYIRCAKDAPNVDLQTRLKASVERRDDWQYAGAYMDAGYSGYNTERPALQKLIKECEAGTVNVVVVDQPKSLSRNVDDCKRLLEFFLRTKVVVYYFGDRTLDSNPSESLVEMPLMRL